MPYIKKEKRAKIDRSVHDLLNCLHDSQTGEPNVGETNYAISSLIWWLFEYKKSYSTANNLIGVLECVKQEFYRRRVAPYEDEKIKENGDLFPLS